MHEVLEQYEDKINTSDALKTLNLEKNKYILISAHREENIDIEDNFNSLMNAINEIAEKYQLPVNLFNTSKKLEKNRGKIFQFHPLVKKLKPFGFSIITHYKKMPLLSFQIVEHCQKNHQCLSSQEF